MTTPIFSIIIPFYNRAHSLARAIGSVLSQTYTDYELILVNDCSTDNSLIVAKTFTDNRIRIITTKQNSGPAGARNEGIFLAKGEYVSFLDSDDEYDPNFLKETFQKFQNVSSKVGFLWTGVSYRSSKEPEKINEIPVWVPKIIDTPYRTFLHGIHIGTGTGLTVRKRVFDTVGVFDDQMKAAEDTDFFLRATQVFEFDCIKKTLIHINKENAGRVSKQYNNIASAYELILSKHIHEIQKVKTLRLKYYYKMLWLAYHTMEKDKARIYFKKILKDSPFHIKSWTTVFLFEILGNTLGRKIHIKMSAI